MSFSVLGTGRAVPDQVITNGDLSRIVDTSDEWIVTRTGIHERRICKNETHTELAAKAAREALDNAGVQPGELDLIICATVQGDYITPSAGCMIQQAIGARCPAFDVNGACSGFLYALDVAAGYFARGTVKKVLVVAVELLSRITDWSDRSTCVLFGDGGGAVVLGEGDGLKSIRLTAKGGAELLRAPGARGDCPFSDPQEKEPSYLYMNGGEVYKFAVVNMCRELKKAIADAGLTQEDITWVFPHQANIRIIKTAQERLSIPAEKYYNRIEEFGNTSAGCIPMMLDEANRNGTLKHGDRIALVAFGGGLTTGACILQW
jgi:3-oxoacyl-[acyl-carrier-protein] synthase-3